MQNSIHDDPPYQRGCVQQAYDRTSEVEGLYIPEMEKDACGIGMIANLKNQKSHLLIEQAITMLENMEHRGACGCEPNTGDGSGIMIQMPHDFLKEECGQWGFELPEFGHYGAGIVFFPREEHLRNRSKELIAMYAKQLHLQVLGYRELPTSNEGVGDSALAVEPHSEHIFITSDKYTFLDLERRLFIFRNYITREVRNILLEAKDFYMPSLSYKTMVYKGQLTTYQLRPYFADLRDTRVVSAIAVVHSRFSTNTFPKWRLAQPFRYIAHNGEINTIKGNYNWWQTKEIMLKSDLFTQEEFAMLFPICDPTQSDSAIFDDVVELLTLCGRSLPHVMMMMIPEAWQENTLMDDDKRAFYEYHKSLMEPWDGPASICFTDGKIVGATLDRNGLRPSRYCVTKNGHLVLASEVGVLPIPPEDIVYKGRLQPGKMLVADLEQGRIISDEELKKDICTRQPYREWLKKEKHTIADLPQSIDASHKLYKAYDSKELFLRQQAFGYTKEDLTFILAPMVKQGDAPLGSMGSDTPLAILSDQSQHLSHYFKQLFAQVTNPPIDSIRERSVMSLFTQVGTHLNVLEETPAHCRQIHIPQPVLTNEELAQLLYVQHTYFKARKINIFFRADGRKDRLEYAIDRICIEAEEAIKLGANILILSDRVVTELYAPIPSLLATGAIHHHLIKKGLRAKASIVVEAGDVRETHHFATLIGFGASAVNPYLALETLTTLKEYKFVPEDFPQEKMMKNYIKAVNKELLKIFSKIGISTLHSYCGAQIFEALGLSKKVIEKCFKGTISRIGGLDFDGIAKEVLIRHKLAFPEFPIPAPRLEVGGLYQWKRRGEFHLFNPQSIHLLQYSTRLNDYTAYQKYAKIINDQLKKACTLRGLMDFNKNRPSIPIEEVEPIENIFKRFATGAMSFGSISYEAHTTLAIAMNRIGGKSNSGEGGEDASRYQPLENGDSMRSAIKQVASGRFGVTTEYLTNADELQIKMAQGAKPGEGGQLPGHKVNEWIGEVRHSTPGVGLISPPPHHDIYSIEDLAQLIYDLKNANRAARINVKLVSEAGVGVVAAGVAKAHADVILIAGHDGGTGASPLSSIRHAGLPWELGLSEAHQTLVKNKLRNRVTLQTDGQIRTGRDLAVATLLGAEEWGVATAALVVEGCIMMRKCHLNTCPVGVATQDENLRARFNGKVEYLINFFTFLAQDLREIMAELGFRTINEMVGQVDTLKVRENLPNWKAEYLDLSPILHHQKEGEEAGLYKQIEQDHGIEEVIDWKLLELAKPALEKGEKVYAELKVINTDRTVGTMLSNEIAKKYGGEYLPDDTIHLKFKGSAGQSFAAFSAKGITFELEGEANDYFGKGLSGAKLRIYPDKKAVLKASENMIIGNVAFYGATSGEAYISGKAGERFCVRNSGVTAVVEGIGDHGCEYMTGGRVVILGETGRNFAAGMSGGIAYVYNPNNTFKAHCNDDADFDEMGEDDFQVLKGMVSSHLEYTDSEVAKELLEDWSEAVKSFVKVMPGDYKRALEEQREKANIEEVEPKRVISVNKRKEGLVSVS
ncbi:MAG: glutamate synthase large subunit [Chitinophagales bacterium]